MIFEQINDSYPTDEIFDVIKELFNKIKDQFSFISNNTKIYTVDNTLNNVDLMMDSFNNLAKMLDENPLFKDEVYLCLSIRTLVEYIVYDMGAINENIYFVANLIINFCKLIRDKQDYILSYNNIDYKKEYQEFRLFLTKQEEYFHLNIYEGSNEHDELVHDLLNILW